MMDNSTVFEPLSLRRPLWDPGRAGAFGIRAQRETAAPSAFEKETWKQGEQSAPRAQAGPAFLSVYPSAGARFFY